MLHITYKYGCALVAQSRSKAFWIPSRGGETLPTWVWCVGDAEALNLFLAVTPNGSPPIQLETSLWGQLTPHSVLRPLVRFIITLEIPASGPSLAVRHVVRGDSDIRNSPNRL